MNLHKIVSGAISQVNPFLDGYVIKNQGYITANDGTRKPVLKHYPVKLQVQATDEDKLTNPSLQNIQGALREVWIYGNQTGIIRPDQKGGDLLIFDNKEWLIVQVKESWPDWTHVICVLQANAVYVEGYIAPITLIPAS